MNINNSFPNLNTHGQTLVSFSDICGFKKMMKDQKKVAKVLDIVFQVTYDYLQREPRLKGIAVSDCVVSWIDVSSDYHRNLTIISNLAKTLHAELIKIKCLMQTSIAFGEFHFEERIQLKNLQKSMFQGFAYLDAFLMNSKVPIGGIVLLRKYEPPEPLSDKWVSCINPKGWEYLWSISNSASIAEFINKRNQIGNRCGEKKKELENSMFDEFIELYRCNQY